MRLHIFNPEHDLAIAANDAHYTPPASARQMAAELQRLPCLWAGPGDVVMLADGSLERWDGDAGSPAGADALRGLEGVMPWGWDLAVARRLRQAGVAERLLPSEAWLAGFRRHTGRATAMHVLGRMKAHSLLHPWQDAIVGEATRCDTVEDALAAYPGPMLFKQPWSGSGRGLRPSAPPHADGQTEAWLRRTLRTQGYVMAEPIYNKVQDLAAELWRHADGRVTFEGLSVFATTAGGVYDGNLVGPEAMKRQLAGEHIDPAMLDAAIGALTDTLREAMAAMPHYVGPVGVDMMLVEGGRMHPCVEINFRMTMGFVALELSRRHPELSGKHFNIVYADGHYQATVG